MVWARRCKVILVAFVWLAEVYPIFEKKERFCGVTKNVSPKIFEIDPHHADKNLQADVFNEGGGGLPPSSAFFGDFMIVEVLYRL